MPADERTGRRRSTPPAIRERGAPTTTSGDPLRVRHLVSGGMLEEFDRAGRGFFEHIHRLPTPFDQNCDEFDSVGANEINTGDDE